MNHLKHFTLLLIVILFTNCRILPKAKTICNCSLEIAKQNACNRFRQECRCNNELIIDKIWEDSLKYYIAIDPKFEDRYKIINGDTIKSITRGAGLEFIINKKTCRILSFKQY